jgi:hypothetical protein
MVTTRARAHVRASRPLDRFVLGDKFGAGRFRRAVLFRDVAELFEQLRQRVGRMRFAGRRVGFSRARSTSRIHFVMSVPGFTRRREGAKALRRRTPDQSPG